MCFKSHLLQRMCHIKAAKSLANLRVRNRSTWLPNSTRSIQWRHNERYDVSDYQPHDCLLNRSIRRRSQNTSKLRVTGLIVGNSPVTDEFPAQRASRAEVVSIWLRHHVTCHQLPPVSIISKAHSGITDAIRYALEFKLNAENCVGALVPYMVIGTCYQNYGRNNQHSLW